MNKLVIRRETANEPKWEGPAPIEGTPPEPQRPKITAEEAERMSAENNRQITESYYRDDGWPLIRVLNWIAFRSPARIGDSSWHRLTYHYPRDANSKSPPVCDDPRRDLIKVLRDGKITASLHGNELSNRFWDSVQFDDLLENHADTWFVSNNIVDLFPESKRAEETNRKLPPNLKDALKEAIKKEGRPLTTREAEKIASAIGAKEGQKETRKVLGDLQGQQRPGPRGPRRAAK